LIVILFGRPVKLNFDAAEFVGKNFFVGKADDRGGLYAK